jgi:hypothetical protein
VDKLNHFLEISDSHGYIVFLVMTPCSLVVHYQCVVFIFRVKLFIGIIKHHSMKAYVRVKIKLHHF